MQCHRQQFPKPGPGVDSVLRFPCSNTPISTQEGLISSIRCVKEEKALKCAGQVVLQEQGWESVEF